MKNRYVGRDVDLLLLGQWIERFFAKKNFRIAKFEEARDFRIEARPTHVHEMVDTITVALSGKSNDFTIEFSSSGRSSVFMRLGALTSLFGGGIAYLRGVKSQEAEEKIEKRFWVYVGEKIDFLANSVRRSRLSQEP